MIEEPNVAGRLDVALLKARGIRPGPLYGQIKNGQDVVCPDGTLLKAVDAMGPERKGELFCSCGRVVRSIEMLQCSEKNFHSANPMGAS